jgi:hypothetical protein
MRATIKKITIEETMLIDVQKTDCKRGKHD